MNGAEMNIWIETAVAGEALGDSELGLDALSVGERAAIVELIRAKSAQLDKFALSGGGFRSKSPKYGYDYSKRQNALLALAAQVDPTLLSNLTDSLGEILGISDE